MDAEFLTQVIALATAAWTLFQEYRHRKDKKATTKDLMPAKRPK